MYITTWQKNIKLKNLKKILRAQLLLDRTYGANVDLHVMHGLQLDATTLLCMSVYIAIYSPGLEKLYIIL